MKKSLYIKFVAFFLILGFIGFFTVSMIGPSMVENHLEDVYSGDYTGRLPPSQKTEPPNTIRNRRLWTALP